MHAGCVLTKEMLDPKFFVSNSSKAEEPSELEQNENLLIRETIRKTKGNKSEAARLLGIPRRTFYRKLEKLDSE